VASSYAWTRRESMVTSGGGEEDELCPIDHKERRLLSDPAG
jgi:hypothetical protein